MQTIPYIIRFVSGNTNTGGLYFLKVKSHAFPEDFPQTKPAEASLVPPLRTPGAGLAMPCATAPLVLGSDEELGDPRWVVVLGVGNQNMGRDLDGA